jgi:hypothetical protein
LPHIPKVGTSAEATVTDGNTILLLRLPSSSRAYPLAFDKKVEAYRQILTLLA